MGPPGPAGGLTGAWLTTGNSGLPNNNATFLGTTDGAQVIVSSGLPTNNNGWVFTNLGQIVFRKGANVLLGNNATGDSITAGGTNNIAIGGTALSTNTTGSGNVAVGQNALRDNVDGNFNVGIGGSALLNSSTGSGNTAVGYLSLVQNGVGAPNNQADENSAFGYSALRDNTLGTNNNAFGAHSSEKSRSSSYNCSFGTYSLANNTQGNYNNAFGVEALRYYDYTGPTGPCCNAFGYQALTNNGPTGAYNNGFGNRPLFTNTEGSKNNAFGSSALFFNTTGDNNSAFGDSALEANTTGDNNTALGANTMVSALVGNRNTAVGYSADIAAFDVASASNNCVALGADASVSLSSSNSCALGANSLAIGTNSTAVGYQAFAGVPNKFRLGNGSVTSLECNVGLTITSDQRFKKNIKQNVPGLAFIEKLNPVSYTFDNKEYCKFINSPEVPQDNPNQRTGLLAQEVHQAAKAVDYDFDGITLPEINGGYYGLQYASFVVPLIKAVQEQQIMINTLNKKIEELMKNKD
jgi:hypothetical protein